MSRENCPDIAYHRAVQRHFLNFFNVDKVEAVLFSFFLSSERKRANTFSVYARDLSDK